MSSPMHDVPGAFQKLQDSYFQANALMNESRYEEAIEIYTDGINFDDNFRHAYVTQYAMRGRCYVNLERYKEAIPDLNKAIEMEPEFNHGDYYFMLARCYQVEVKDNSIALACYSKAIEVNPNDLEAYYFRGVLQFELENYTQALSDVEHMIDSYSQKIDEEIIQMRDKIRNKIGLEPVKPEPEIFPGQPIAKLSDYIRLMKQIQQGDLNGALANYGLDIMQYSSVAQQWGMKLASDPELATKYTTLIAK
jgi:tetratricopeptide (TPR) repeat protein